MKRIDLNVDIGEGFPFDRELLSYATSANICCGDHAGDWELTRETIGLALDAGARIGMHPGYPDRAEMGRAACPSGCEAEYAESIRRQCERFYNFVPAAYWKPHGALYNESTDSETTAFAIVREIGSRYRLPMMGLPGTAHALAGGELIREGFADRAYTPDGRLVPRSQPGAVLGSPGDVRRQVVRLAPQVDSICIHGDTPDCLTFAELVFSALADAGYEVACPE